MTIKTYKKPTFRGLLFTDLRGFNYSTQVELVPGDLIRRWSSDAVGVIVSNCDGYVTVLFSRQFEDMYEL